MLCHVMAHILDAMYPHTLFYRDEAYLILLRGRSLFNSSTVTKPIQFFYGDKAYLIFPGDAAYLLYLKLSAPVDRSHTQFFPGKAAYLLHLMLS